MNKLILCVMLAIISITMPSCRSTANPNGGTSISQQIRQKLEELPEPTFESLEVYTHDLSAKGVAYLVEKYPDAKVPLRIFAESSISILEKETITMVDVIALSNSLDEIKDGKVKLYLDLAWTLLELNGVIRRDDLTATLTAREQRLVIALCHGIRLGTDPEAERDALLNAYGPRYGAETKQFPPAGAPKPN